MRNNTFAVIFGIAGPLTAMLPETGVAQQVTGTLGSPSATTTIPGNQLPPPPPKFGGVITQDAKTSKPWWPPTVVPPKGAPNVLLIMTDDSGYGVPSTFGGVIPTPSLDRVAKSGLRYTQFHSTALCSPTRAALITGRNHHAVGFGQVSELATGFPGYDSVIGPENATVGRILERQRLRHLVVRQEPQHALLPVQRRPVPSTSGPAGMGFQYFYGFMGGESDQWTPYLFRDHTPVFPWVGKTGLQPDHRHGGRRDPLHEGARTPRPRTSRSSSITCPARPIRPHHPTKEWIDKISKMQLFDQGWEKLREQIFANQKRLGVIPPNTQLTPWPDSLPKWDSLSAVQKKIVIRQADVFAAYTAYTDHEIGRVIQAVAGHGQARQHADHLHQRRQRHQLRRHA